MFSSVGERTSPINLYVMFLISVHGVIPEPQNVRIYSRDFNSTLLWDPPNFHEEDVTYTVEFEK